jgi:alanyl-tRNA synthetase
MSSEKAFKSGATALFEEKYGDRVRVVSLSGFSKELCGGTHTQMTGDIGLFRIVGESSIASGVRRIEALTGEAAMAYTLQQVETVQDAARLLKAKPDHLVEKIEAMIAGQKSLEKEIEQLKVQVAQYQAGDAKEEIQTVNGTNLLIKKVAVDSPAALRDLADRLKDRIQSGIVVLGGVSGSKVLLIACVTKDLVGRFHAGDIVKGIAPLVGGGGGGRPDMAQAGGTRPEKLDEALGAVQKIVEGA